MNLITPEAYKDCQLQPYITPKLDVITLEGKLSLLESLSLKGGLENWEVGDEVINLEDGH